MDPSFIIMIVLVFGAMFLMTRGSRKRQKEAMAFRDSMAPGAQVMTASGYVGTVVAIDGDLVTLESESGSRTKWVRAAIAKEYEVAPAAAPVAAESGTETSGFAVPDDVSSLISKREDDITKLPGSESAQNSDSAEDSDKESK